MSEIDFELGKVFMAEIVHRSGGDGVWLRGFNANSEEAAKNEAVRLFEEDGYRPILIDRIIITELEFPSGQ